MNYTKEMTEAMIEQYEKNPTRETVKALAERFNKSEKSVIGKLAKEGVYRREQYTSKTGEKPITKLELVGILGQEPGIEERKLVGLEKTPKLTLKYVVEYIQKINNNNKEG